MSDINKNILKKQQANLDNSKRWLRRAKMDFNAFKILSKLDTKTWKTTRCTDPALAVYLLQQSIEKATKAVAAATGKYSYRMLKKESHNTLGLLLGFYQQVLTDINKRPELNAIGIGLGIDLGDGLKKINNLIPEAKRTPKEKVAGETLFSEQLAQATKDGIKKMLDFLLLVRERAFIGVPKSIFGPHNKIIIDKQNLDTSTYKDFVASAVQELAKQLNLSQLSDTNIDLLEDTVKLLAPNGIIDDDDAKSIVIERPTKDQLGQWSMIALLVLAMYTFPHESTARYPGPETKGDNSKLEGCEDYNNNLGIVNLLGQMGHIAMLALNEIEPELEAISNFYPAIETKHKKAKSHNQKSKTT